MNDFDSIFSDFETQDLESWKNKLKADLKLDAIDNLRKKSELEGLSIEPIYNLENIIGDQEIEAIQNAQLTQNDRLVAQFFINKAIGFNDLKVQILNAFDAGLEIAYVADHWDLKELQEFCKKKLGGKKIKIVLQNQLVEFTKQETPFDILIDPISSIYRDYHSFEEYPDLLDQIFQTKLNRFAADDFLLVDLGTYIDDGASIVQALSYGLHHLTDYIDKLLQLDYTIEAISRSMVFKYHLSNSYFDNIVALRSLRYLIQKVFAYYDQTIDPVIWSHSSVYHLAHQDTDTNFLRLTTQAMSALIGNTSKLSLEEYDEQIDRQDFAQRMSRNIQLILKHEAKFFEVDDMAKGAYFIESYTRAMCEKVWAAYIELEQSGSLMEKIKSGEVAKAIQESKDQRVADYKANKTMIGVNKYQADVKEDSTSNQPRLSKEILA